MLKQSARNYFLLLLIGGFLFLSPAESFAFRDPGAVTDWYIDTFQSSIQVNRDSSLLITEMITADCGTLPNKHGIFRVLPTQTKTDNGTYKTPIELVSITDFNGSSYKYQTINDNYNHTITWKIGDSGKTVTGVNYYKIVYKVKNAIRFDNSDKFDEFYWNLSGNFWQIDIDKFSSTIYFPEQVLSSNSQVDYYTGYFGEEHKFAIYRWNGSNLTFNSLGPIFPGEGITASVTFPKGIFTPTPLNIFEKYADYLSYIFLLIPILVFKYTFSSWKRFGKDPVMKKPIPPEFEIPENITPTQMGVIIGSGFWDQRLITAAIVDLAVKKFITINEKKEKVLFVNYDNIEIIKNKDSYNEGLLNKPEKVLLGQILKGKDSVSLTDLTAKFYKDIPDIKKAAEQDVVDKGWIEGKSNLRALKFLGAGVAFFFLSFWAATLSPILFIILSASGVILFIFGLLMPKRTQKGTDLMFRIKGLKRYMETAENFRQQFYEKENIFDKLLPYAIVFGIAKLWAKKMEIIYGKDYFTNYHPVWIAGMTAGNFDANSFASQLNTITSSISSSTGSSSGSGGGGGAGGGGGGGGGGGW